MLNLILCMFTTEKLQCHASLPGLLWLDNFFFLFDMKQERESPTLTEWDRFAHREYIRLSMEEDVEDASNGSAEVWDEPLEAPF